MNKVLDLLVVFLCLNQIYLLNNVSASRASYTTDNYKTHKPHSTSKHQVSTKVVSAHQYTVYKVADGDTVTLRNISDYNREVRVRFFCIDAPEKSQGKWGELSLKKLAELLPIGNKVTLVGSIIDLYGRTVSEIVNNKNMNVNKQMVELGLAVHYPFQKGCNDYKELEKNAKAKKLGVWSDSSFEMPWDYRKRMGIGARGRHNSPDKGTTSKYTTSSKHVSKKISAN